MKTPVRMAFLIPGGIALLAGLDAALLLLGLPAPVSTDRLPQVHGGLLVLGFVGTVIALERAVALRRWWGFLAPGSLGVGAVVLLSAAPVGAGKGLLLLGMLVQLAVYAALWRRQESAALTMQILGAMLAAGAAVLWLASLPVAAVLPWFAGYLILTIAGERLELARVGALGRRTEATVPALAVLLFAAVVGTLLWPTAGHLLLGATLLTLVVVLLQHDVARRMVRSTGLPRYMGWCLLAGYGWLVVAGGIWVLLGRVGEGPGYDAVVHAVFLGFTMSMIMAHAPVILPAVLGKPLPYGPAFYLPVVLLHTSLLLRVVGGDLYESVWALQVGGALNIAAVLLFVAVVIWSGVRAPRRAAARPVRTAAPVMVAAS